MSCRNSKIKQLSEDEIQKLIDELEAYENMTDEEFEEHLKERAKWLFDNNKIDCVATLNRDTHNLIHKAYWYTDLSFDDFIDYATRQFAIKVLKANGCDVKSAALDCISVDESKMGSLELDEGERLDDNSVYSYLGIIDRTLGGKYVVMIPDLGVAAFGATEEDALDSAEEVLTSTLHSMKARNCPLPEPADHRDELDRCQGWGFVYSLPLSIFQSIEEFRKGTLRTSSLSDLIKSINFDA